MELRNFTLYFLGVMFLVSLFFIGSESESPLVIEPPTVDPSRLCNKTIESKFFTTCKPCPANENTNCPYGTQKLTTGTGLSGCSYLLILMGHKMMLKGCRHQCVRHSQIRMCCSGYWGFACQKCPGGARNPCSGRGDCSDGSYGNGTCACVGQFGGFACETCAKHYQFGVNCTGECRCLHGICSRGILGDGTCFCDAGWKGRYCDKEIPACDTLACHEHAQCVEEGDSIGAKCVCHLGYQGDGKQTCDPINPCSSNPCHADAICNMTSPGNHTCSCKPGYTGDGLVCQVVNPCQTGYGGCEVISTNCIFDGPGKSHCECNPGYENYQAPEGCSLIDICFRNTSLCHPSANCTTLAPGAYECKCQEGYIGDGFTCYGNILQRLIEINVMDKELSGKLDEFIRLVQTTLYSALTQHGPFTLFATIDDGFKGTTLLNEIKTDKDRAKQVLKQHLVISDMKLDQLSNVSHFYTLLGSPAEMKYKDREIDIYKYRLQGAPTKGTVLRPNIIASNGLIHVIDKVIGKLPEIIGSRQNLIFTLLRNDGRYNRFEQLLLAADLQDVLKKRGPYVVLAPNNGAWDALPEGTVDYLLTEEARGMLRAILLNHIYYGDTLLSEDLVNIQRFKTYANNYINVSITELGQIRLDNKANITQTDIPAMNGYFHHIDAVLIPYSVGTILPHRCDVKQYQSVRGSCGPCHRISACTAPDDEPLNKTMTGCRYWVNLRFRYVAFRGCAQLCNRTIITKKCCPGFYSDECLPCPGGHINFCSNHGKCDDGYLGNGTCKCEPGFYGRNCEYCTDKTKFGPNCDQKCTCIKGICDSGTRGNGKCNPGSCEANHQGPNCEMQKENCGGGGWKLRCHAHASCKDLKFVFKYMRVEGTCVCKEGYAGDGSTCIEVNPCIEVNRGGCHEQAECRHTGPGLHVCNCTEGWIGDGKYCYPSTPCRVHNQCHQNARCIDTSPGKYICRCMDNYHGNGTHCIWNDMCTKNNGGCDKNAYCTSTGPGKNKCTCNEEYYGDGRICLRTILGEIRARPEIEETSKILRVLSDSINYLDDPQGKYTVFIPTNAVVLKFRKRANNQFWLIQQNIIELLCYHALRGAYTIEQLYIHSGLNDDVDTLLSGHRLNVTLNANNYSVDGAHIVDANIAAINGYIHIVDKVLEPYPIPDDQRHPLLIDMLTSQKLIKFRDYLNSSGFINQLNYMEDDFTVFAPTDAAFDNKQLNISMRYLSSYAVGELLTSKVFYNTKRSKTMLGGMFQIVWHKTWKETRVNDALIVKTDLMVDGGVVHIIDGLFNPVLNRCDQRNVYKKRSLCEACFVEQATCPTGYNQSSQFRIPHCNVTVRGRLRQGCYSFCEKVEETVECCPSFFGRDCRVCPGGIDNPCNGNGRCDDGMDGTGKCTCWENFTGKVCDVCVKGKRGETCDETITCKANNGYCHADALCSGPDKDVTCKCKDGFFGDGKNCTHWCDVDNGGCLDYVTCKWNSQSNSVQCQCPDDMYGDGKTWCKVILNHCKAKNGGCHPNANCTFTPPTEKDKPDGKVDCQCREGYVGDGIQCNSDIYTTINTLSSMRMFSKMLKSSSKSNPGILDLMNKLENDTTQMYSVFVPVDYVSKLYTRNDIANMIVADLITLNNTGNYTCKDYKSLAGQPISIMTKSLNGTDIVYVNDVTITEMNIPATNGIIHFTNKPLLYPITKKIPPKTRPSHATSSSHARYLLKVVVATVVAVVVVVIIIALVAARSRMRSKRVKADDDTKNLIATFSKDGNEDLGFSHLENQPSDDETDNKKAKNKKKNSRGEISYGHSFNNPLYDTAVESNPATSFPF